MNRNDEILVVEDERSIADVVEYVLSENGFSVKVCEDGDLALKAFHAGLPALVLLDLNLPGMDGLSLFRAMRAVRPAQPVIMLTSRSDEVDRVVGLEMGADDYVTKPFSPRELLARVRAVLRRSAPQEEQDSNLLHFGPLILNRAACRLDLPGTAIRLTAPELRLMERLMRHPARCFSRDELLDAMYDEAHIAGDRSVDACIKRIRTKCRSADPNIDPIETLYGLGYKMKAALSE